MRTPRLLLPARGRVLRGVRVHRTRLTRPVVAVRLVLAALIVALAGVSCAQQGAPRADASRSGHAPGHVAAAGLRAA